MLLVGFEKTLCIRILAISLARVDGMLVIQIQGLD